MSATPPTTAFERWKQFAATARLDVSDDELRGIAETLDRLFADTREALKSDLGFIEPVLVFTCREIPQ